MSKTYILYKDIPPGADEDAEVSTNGAQPFSTLALPFGTPHAPIATCELNAWGLDGSFGMVDGCEVAFWSISQSGADCLFDAQPVITIDFDAQYSSTGISFAFNEADWCDLVNVQWWQQDTLKADVDFTLTTPTYFCKRKVLSYDRIVITLKRTRLPYHYAKLDRIYFGVYRRFDMQELRQGKVSITNEIDPLALELPVSTMDWRLDSRDEADYLFQFKQPVEVYNDERLINAYYIDESAQVTGRLYDISTFDAFGVLGESPFAGGVYTDKSARALLEEIVGGDFELDISAEDIALTGAILPCTRREAMQQVLFRWGVCAATDGSAKIRVFALPEEGAEQIGENRVFPGAPVATASAVTAVKVTAHQYTQSDDGDIEIGGVKYRDTTTVYTVNNPDATAADRANVKEIPGATLVSPDIAQAVAQRVFEHYARRNTAKPKIVWRGESLGQLVTVPNGWGGTVTGHLTRMEIRLSNTVVANSEVRGQ